MGVRNITVYLTGDPSNLRNALRVAAADVDRFVSQTQRKGAASAGALDGVGKGAGNAARLVQGGLLAVGSALAAAGAAAGEFDAAMRNVNSIQNTAATTAAESEARFRAQSAAVLELSRTVPQSATTLAKGLYEIASSGFQGAQGLEVLQASAKAATAGLSDTDTAATAIAAALNAYGLSAASATDVSDTLFQTVNAGVVTFGDLSQQLGDFVGTAAAAGVPLGDVAAAFATITTQGVPAAQAATSINQVLVQLLKPTDAMAAELEHLGYASGATALQTDGLRGVIEKLRKDTGGSADQMVRLFGNVEAARGALALMANDGHKYAEVQAQVADRTNAAGATQRAFAEQMKGANAQVRLALNGLQADAIALGTQLLPVFTEIVRVAHEAGADAVPILIASFQRVQPILGTVFGIVADIVRILGQLQSAAAPVERALAGIAAATVLGPLQLLLNIIKAVTGLLADHSEVVVAAAAAYAAFMLPSLVATVAQVIAFNARLAYQLVILPAVTALTGGAAAAQQGLAAALTLTNLAMAGAAVGIGLLVAGIAKHNAIVQESAQTFEQQRKSFSVYDTKRAQETIGQDTAKVKQFTDAVGQYNGVWGTFKAGITLLPGASGEVDQLANDAGKAAENVKQFQEQLGNANTNLGYVASKTGLTVEALRQIAQQQNIDISKPFSQSAAEVDRLIRYVGDFKNADSVAMASVQKNTQMSIEDWQALEEQVTKVTDAVSQAFQRDTDVIGKYDPSKYADAVAKAEERVRKAREGSGGSAVGTLRDEQSLARARQRVSDAEERAAVSRSRTASSRVSQIQSVRRAQQALADLEARQATAGRSGSRGGSELADAQKALADARAEQAANSLENTYKRAVASGREFTRNINTVLQNGLDPQAVVRLLKSGPEQANPILEQMVGAHGKRIIDLVNQNEKTLGQINEQAVIQARITSLAINSQDTYFVQHMKEAMAIAAAEAASGGKATTAALARNLHMNAKQIEEIARRFGIPIANAVENEVKKHPVKLSVSGTIDFSPSFGRNPSQATQDLFRQLARPSASAGRGQQPRFEGGPLDGPPGRDAAVFRGTRGEWVQPVAAVQYYGTELMEAIRTRALPKDALPRRFEGGPLGGGLAYDGSWVQRVVSVQGPRVVPVPVPIATRQNIDNSVNVRVDRVEAGAPGAMTAWSAAQGRRYSPTQGVS